MTGAGLGGGASGLLRPLRWLDRQRARLDDVGVPSGRGWYLFKFTLGTLVALVLVGAALGQIGRAAGSPLDATAARSMAAGAVGIATVVLLWWRARYPVAVLAAVVAGDVARGLLHHGSVSNMSIIPVAIALYALAVRRPPGTSLPALVATWVALAVSAHAVAAAVSSLFLLAAVTAVAFYVRSHQALVASLRERAEQAERARALSAAQAVSEERVRIARELHDVVAHHVSLMVVQAGAVRASLDPDEHAWEVVDSMVRGGRQAMVELRDMLGALRVADPAQTAPGAGVLPRPPRAAPVGEAALTAPAGSGAPRQPQPDVRQVSELVSGALGAGLPVELTVEGEAPGVPSTAAFAAYRIVQEALTNAVRHAPGAHTVVRIRHEDEGIALSVTNGPSGGSPAPSAGAGHGLLGMRERAALCGGWIQARPTGAGYRVEGWLPHAEARPTPAEMRWVPAAAPPARA